MIQKKGIADLFQLAKLGNLCRGWFVSRLVRASLVLGAAALAISSAGLFGRAPGLRGEANTARPSAPFEPPGTPYRTVSVAGCASAACHGGPATTSLSDKLDSHTWQGSATHYLACDPHTKAFATLESPLAKSIMDRLRSSVMEATEDVRCLACHTNPALASSEVNNRERSLRRDGVSCEACHGNASKWLHSHTTWSAADRCAGYKRSGMTKLYDLGERALACAGCHVGAPAAQGYPVRDMNHDMIAAGHPRLNFDFADYQRRLRPHWFERDRMTGAPVGPEFEVRAWLVGRVAHAEAAVRLTADRTERAAPWPEFAETNCYSCHHQLLPDGWKQRNLAAKPGTAPRQTIWPLTSPDDAAELKGLVSTAVVAKLPDDRVLQVASSLFAKVRGRDSIADWDTAGQIFLGAAAYERYRVRITKSNPNPDFDVILNKLRLPHKLGDEWFLTPCQFSPMEAASDLKKLLPK